MCTFLDISQHIIEKFLTTRFPLDFTFLLKAKPSGSISLFQWLLTPVFARHVWKLYSWLFRSLAMQWQSYLWAGAPGQSGPTDLLWKLSGVSKPRTSQCPGQPALQVVGQAWGRPDGLHPNTPKGEQLWHRKHSRPFKLEQFYQYYSRVHSTATLRKCDNFIQKVWLGRTQFVLETSRVWKHQVSLGFMNTLGTAFS